MIKPEDKLKQLMNDPHYLEAIKWAFGEIIENNKPTDKNIDNVLLGEKYRAYMTAQDFIEQGIKKIESYKDNLKNNDGFDKAV